MDRALAALQKAVGPLVMSLRRPDGRKWPQVWATSSKVVWSPMIGLEGLPAMEFECVSRYREKRFDIGGATVVASQTGEKIPLDLSCAKCLYSGDVLEVELVTSIGYPWRVSKEE
jgi:hypothetical protein